MCQSTSLMEAATVSCSRSILSALHPLRSSTKKRLNHPRPRWSRRDSTGGKKWMIVTRKRGSCLRVNWVTPGWWLCGRAGTFLHGMRLEARGSADRAIAHWRDAGTKWTIIVVPNSWHILCAMSKIAFYTKNRITTQNCAGADVTVTSCFCNETVSTHTCLVSRSPVMREPPQSVITFETFWVVTTHNNWPLT